MDKSTTRTPKRHEIRNFAKKIERVLIDAGFKQSRKRGGSIPGNTTGFVVRLVGRSSSPLVWTYDGTDEEGYRSQAAVESHRQCIAVLQAAGYDVTWYGYVDFKPKGE